MTCLLEAILKMNILLFIHWVSRFDSTIFRNFLNIEYVFKNKFFINSLKTEFRKISWNIDLNKNAIPLVVIKEIQLLYFDLYDKDYYHNKSLFHFFIKEFVWNFIERKMTLIPPIGRFIPMCFTNRHVTRWTITSKFNIITSVSHPGS